MRVADSPRMSMPPTFEMMGPLMLMRRLDVASCPPLLAIGFRLTDMRGELWTSRFNAFKQGHPAAVAAGIRAMQAGFQGATRAGMRIRAPVVVVGAISSADTALQVQCPVWQLGAALAADFGWEWRPDALSKSVHRSLHGLRGAGTRDTEVAGRYRAERVDGTEGTFLIVDDLCTRGATLAEVGRALRAASPDCITLATAVAKTENSRYWAGRGGIDNSHIPAELDRAWDQK